MSEMVERVARGMHLKRPNSRITRWEDCSDEYRTGTLRDAHAAIETMREPTQMMIEEAWADATAEDAAGVWRAMIDEALK